MYIIKICFGQSIYKIIILKNISKNLKKKLFDIKINFLNPVKPLD